jgi:WD40 repeat protein
MMGGWKMKESSQSTSADLFSRVEDKSIGKVPHPKIDKTLAATRYRDDFYLNNLDWGKHGVAVALGEDVFVECKDGFEQIGEVEPSDYVASVKLLDDILSVGWANGHIQLYDVTRNICFRKIKEHNKRVSVQNRHQHPNLLLTGSKDNDIISHDLRLKKSVIASYKYHRGEVCSLEFQSSGYYFASGSNDNRVVVWDTRKSDPMLKLKGHRGAVKALGWCSWKNSVLCTGGGTGDRSLRLWNTQ